ncbi:hypothetical protein [Actinoplanes siamensis]|uniref:Uncharacterized protein n=1 Tax=Actinoplanes siamensis TaxID=1223317 RepID=A0A919N8F0_9ACTN|nr:hypothetical protein [Actinoplanes siamensis]GIF06372.1 hypothetical protein Asi03nite_39100 [Actinoplanes siamensis]
MTTAGKLADHPVRVMIGAGTGVLGALALLLTPAGLVLLAAGGTLIFWHRLRPPASFALVGAVAGAVAGPLATLGVRTEQVCCMFAWSEERGWPYAWLSRSAGADSLAEAHRLAVAAGWHPDPATLITDAVLWAYTSFLVFVAIGLVWRIVRERRRRRPL